MKRIMNMAIVLVIWLLAGAAGAQTSWNSAAISNADRNTTGSGSFTWSTTGAWDLNNVANGAGLSVSLEPRLITSTADITVDGNYTVGKLTSRSSNQSVLFTGSGKLIFDNNGADTVWNNHSYTTRFPSLRRGIDVDVQLNNNLELRFGITRIPDTGTGGRYSGRIGRVISGTGKLTLSLVMNDSTTSLWMYLGAIGANQYQGGTLVRYVGSTSYGSNLQNSQARVHLDVQSTGAFGTGDVTIDGTGCTHSLTPYGARGMVVKLSAENTINTATNLYIINSTNVYLHLTANQTVAALYTNGTPVANGTYTGGSFDWLYGSGTLTVGTGGTPEPEMAVLGNNASMEIASGSSTVSQPLGTDFGPILWSGTFSATNTFVITNTGLAALTLSGAPVTVLGDHSADFTVTHPLSSSIPAGQSVSFKITCDPSALGVRTGLVSIANNDSNENPYTFNIQGTGTDPLPVMSILSSNGTLVVTNGASVISEALGNDFGEILWIGAVSAERTFVITNKGTANLTLTLPITVSGVDSADFTITQPASSTLGIGQSVTFTITCDPSAIGVKTGLVSIVNNDTSPYRFPIRATGIPEQLSFQQGDGGAFSDTAFTYIQERYGATNNFGNDVIVKLEEEYGATTHFLFQGLIAFSNIIGKAKGQIYPESTVSSATLTLTVSDEGNASVPVTLHRMLKPWVESEATWTLLSAGVPFGNAANNPLDNAAALAANPADPIDNGGGMPGVDYVEASAASHVAYPLGKVTFDVTAVVQAWANGTPNYGLFLQYLDVNGIQIHSDDASTPGNRPKLVVVSTPPPPKGTMISFK